MERYKYEMGEAEFEIWENCADCDEQNHILASRDGYLIFDTEAGHIDERAIAFCEDPDVAAKIVAALNRTV